MPSTTEPRQVTLKGVITAAAWDEQAKVSRVMLQCIDEQEYLVDGRDVGNELIALVQRPVVLTGVVSVQGRKKKVIRVSSYRVISDGSFWNGV